MCKHVLIPVHTVPYENYTFMLGINIVPVGKMTWAQKGEEHVGVIGLDEKRQLTILPGVAASGDSVGWQVVLEGNSDKILPTNSPGYKKLMELGVDVTTSSNH